MRNNNLNPIFLIANSSWYLSHYRKLLLKELNYNKNYRLITISPIDSYTKEISKFSLNIPWRISRSGNKNIFLLFISLLRLILIFRTMKPKLVHSHTLKTNFLTSLVAFFFSTPCIISFAGLGQISNSKGLKRFILLMIIKIMIFLSLRELKGNCIIKNYKRCSFIFQNKKDMNFIKNVINIPNKNTNLIFGSGVPDNYINENKKNNWIYSEKHYSSNSNEIKLDFIYLSRLLKSKGILTFIQLANHYEFHNYSIYGVVDPSSSDSLNKQDINNFKLRNNNLHFHGLKKNPLLNQNYRYPILLVPSIYGEGLPRGIIEAMALHIPVISSQNASCDLFDESLIYISKENSINSYKNCISEVIKDFNSGKIKTKLKKGNEFVKKDLLESQVVKKTISLYEEMEKLNNQK